MTSGALRSLLLMGIAAGLLAFGGAQLYALAETSSAVALSLGAKEAAGQSQATVRAGSPVAVPGTAYTVTGILYTQPVTISGSIWPSALITPPLPDNGWFVWDDFTLATTHTITEVDWIGGAVAPATAVDDFQVSFYTSTANNTQPYVFSPLVSYMGGGAISRVFYGSHLLNQFNSYAFTLPTPFTATGGEKYWVQIEAYQATGPDWGIATGTGGNGKHFLGTPSNTGGIVYSAPGRDTAFTLLGPVVFDRWSYLPLIVR